MAIADAGRFKALGIVREMWPSTMVKRGNKGKMNHELPNLETPSLIPAPRSTSATRSILRAVASQRRHDIPTSLFMWTPSTLSQGEHNLRSSFSWRFCVVNTFPRAYFRETPVSPNTCSTSPITLRHCRKAIIYTRTRNLHTKCLW